MQIEELKGYLSRFGIRPTKKKGQNFLLDDAVLDEMVQAAGVTKNDIVVEVGPGFGVLTEKLCQRAGQVIAIELDKKIAEFLRAEIVPKYPNLILLEGDVLSRATYHQFVKTLYGIVSPGAEPDSEDESYKEVLETLDKKFKVVANLPYQITSRLLRQFLEALPRPMSLTVMVQKEVAERMTAGPGQMSLLALAAQTASTPHIVALVPAEVFFPVPEVDSAVIHCDVMHPNEAFEALDAKQKKQFWRLAKAGFAAKRKQLQRNVKNVLAGHDTLSLLDSAGISAQARAQELAIEDWIRLLEVSQ